MRILKILDLDLDFFLNKKFTSFGGSKGRTDPKEYKPWSTLEVTEFLEKQCGLSELKKTNGAAFVNHDEVFYFLRSLQESNNFELQFSIDHVDAHADLGMGDSAYAYILMELIKIDINLRCYNLKGEKWHGINQGNFLLFAAACRWIRELNYVNRLDWVNDLNSYCFFNQDKHSGFLHLEATDEGEIHVFLKNRQRREHYQAKYPEPKIPFSIVDYAKFSAIGPYDYIFITHSPLYTPPSADFIIDIVKRYFN